MISKIEKIENIIKPMGDYGEVERTKKGIVVSLMKYEIDWGYNEISSNSDEVYDIIDELENLCGVSNLIMGDEAGNEDVDKFVREVLELPSDDYSIGDSREYITILIKGVL